MDDFSHILQSKKPDKELEYFWLTLRHCFVEHLTDNLKESIFIYKTYFDNLQQIGRAHV